MLDSEDNVFEHFRDDMQDPLLASPSKRGHKSKIVKVMGAWGSDYLCQGRF